MGNRACKCLERPASESADKNARQAEAVGPTDVPEVSFHSHLEAVPIDSMIIAGSFNDCSSVSSCVSECSINDSCILLDRIDTSQLEAAVADGAEEDELVSIIHNQMMAEKQASIMHSQTGENQAVARDPVSPANCPETPQICKIDEDEQMVQAAIDSPSRGSAATPRSCKISQVDALMTPPGSPAQVLPGGGRTSTVGRKRRQSQQCLLAAVDRLVEERRNSLSSTTGNNRTSIAVECRRHRRSLLKAAEVVEAADVPDPKVQEMLARVERALERARHVTIPIQFYPAYPTQSSASVQFYPAYPTQSSASAPSFNS